MSNEPSEQGKDRRRHPRISTDMSGTLQCEGEFKVSVLNVSRSGAFAISTRQLPEMAQVKIRLEVILPDEEPQNLLCEAAVVRCDRRPDGQFDVGLFFTSMGTDDAKLLSQILESQTIPTNV